MVKEVLYLICTFFLLGYSKEREFEEALKKNSDNQISNLKMCNRIK